MFTWALDTYWVTVAFQLKSRFAFETQTISIMDVDGFLFSPDLTLIQQRIKLKSLISLCLAHYGAALARLPKDGDCYNSKLFTLRSSVFIWFLEWFFHLVNYSYSLVVLWVRSGEENLDSLRVFSWPKPLKISSETPWPSTGTGLSLHTILKNSSGDWALISLQVWAFTHNLTRVFQASSAPVTGISMENSKKGI